MTRYDRIWQNLAAFNGVPKQCENKQKKSGEACWGIDARNSASFCLFYFFVQFFRQQNTQWNSQSHLAETLMTKCDASSQPRVRYQKKCKEVSPFCQVKIAKGDTSLNLRTSKTDGTGCGWPRLPAQRDQVAYSRLTLEIPPSWNDDKDRWWPMAVTWLMDHTVMGTWWLRRHLAWLLQRHRTPQAKDVPWQRWTRGEHTANMWCTLECSN